MTKFCARMAADEEGSHRCISCDYNATQQVTASGVKFLTYHCHAGLTETLIPIVLSNNLVGYICLGQYIDKVNTVQSWENTRALLAQWHCDPDSFYEDFQLLATLEPALIRAGVEILIACSAYICNECLSNSTAPTELELITAYLDTHFTQKL